MCAAVARQGHGVACRQPGHILLGLACQDCYMLVLVGSERGGRVEAAVCMVGGSVGAWVADHVLLGGRALSG